MINEIQQGSYNALLHKLLSMKEPEPAPTLAPEMLSALVLEMDRPEWSFLKGERIGIGGAFLAGDAVNRPRVYLFNPVGSGVLGTVLDVVVSSDSAATVTWEMRFTNSVGAAIAQNRAINRDLRSIGVPGGNIPMTLQIFAAAQAASGVGSVIYTGVLSVGASPVVIPLDFVLPPGFGLEVDQQNVSGTISANWRWRERILDLSETR